MNDLNNNIVKYERSGDKKQYYELKAQVTEQISQMIGDTRLYFDFVLQMVVDGERAHPKP